PARKTTSASKVGSCACSDRHATAKEAVTRERFGVRPLRVKDESSDPPERVPGSERDSRPDRQSEPPGSGLERRRSDRYEVTWSVDCQTEDTFLYAYITNISEMGIFVKTEKPLAVGTRLILR